MDFKQLLEKIYQKNSSVNVYSKKGLHWSEYFGLTPL